MDYYLKAASEAALMTALEAVNAVKSYAVKDEQGETIETRWAAAPGYNLDVIGVVYKPTGNFIQQTVGDTTVEIPEVAAVPGFHANLRGPADLAPKVVAYQPTTAEAADPNFEMPEPTITPSPIQELLVYPQSPSRVWF